MELVKEEFNPLEVNIDKLPHIFDSLDCFYVRFGVCNKFKLKVKRIHIWNLKLHHIEMLISILLLVIDLNFFYFLVLGFEF